MNVWGEPSPGRRMILTKMETFLKVFEKIDVKVVLVPTNMIIGQLNIMDYEYDNGDQYFASGEL